MLSGGPPKGHLPVCMNVFRISKGSVRMFFRNYRDLTWEEIDKTDKSRSCIVLPVAAIEQHGKHMPIGTDDFVLEMCMEGLNKRNNETGMDFYKLPELSIGSSFEHMNFPGTITFATTTYFNILNDIVSSLSHSGFHKLVIVNGHGGNTALLSGFSQELNQKYDMEIYNLDLPAIYNRSNEIPELKDLDVACDVHAGDIETSLLLYGKSNLVHMERAENYPIYFKDFYFSWLTNKVSHDGQIGKPLNASSKRGELILGFMIDEMEKIFRDISDMEW